MPPVAARLRRGARAACLAAPLCAAALALALLLLLLPLAPPALHATTGADLGRGLLRATGSPSGGAMGAAEAHLRAQLRARAAGALVLARGGGGAQQQQQQRRRRRGDKGAGGEAPPWRTRFTNGDVAEFRRSCARYLRPPGHGGGGGGGGGRRWVQRLAAALAGGAEGAAGGDRAAAAGGGGERNVSRAAPSALPPPLATLAAGGSVHVTERYGQSFDSVHHRGVGGVTSAQRQLRLYFFHMSYNGGTTLCSTARANGYPAPSRRYNCNLGPLLEGDDAALKGADVHGQCTMLSEGGRFASPRIVALEGWQPLAGLWRGEHTRAVTVVRQPASYAVSRWQRWRVEVEEKSFAAFLRDNYRHNELVQRLSGRRSRGYEWELEAAAYRLARFDHVLLTERFRETIEPLRCAHGWPVRLVDPDGRMFAGTGHRPAVSREDATSADKVEEALRSDPAAEQEARALLREKTALDRRLHAFAVVLAEMQVAGYALAANVSDCERGVCDKCSRSSWPEGSPQAAEYERQADQAFQRLVRYTEAQERGGADAAKDALGH